MFCKDGLGKIQLKKTTLLSTGQREMFPADTTGEIPRLGTEVGPGVLHFSLTWSLFSDPGKEGWGLLLSHTYDHSPLLCTGSLQLLTLLTFWKQGTWPTTCSTPRTADSHSEVERTRPHKGQHLNPCKSLPAPLPTSLCPYPLLNSTHLSLWPVVGASLCFWCLVNSKTFFTVIFSPMIQSGKREPSGSKLIICN